MMTTNRKPLKILQWNARGITKSRLEELRRFLSVFVHSVVFLSETHGSDAFNVNFFCRNVIKKNRPNERDGVVAILVHKSLKFSPLHLDHLNSLEVVAVLISTSSQSRLDLISVYAPRGDSLPEEISSLFFVQPSFCRRWRL